MFRWLLGIGAAQNEIESDLRFEWLSAPSGERAFFLVLGILAACGLVWFLYRWEAKRIHFGGRLLLAALRIAVIGTIVAMLCEPISVLTTRLRIPSHFLVLVDASQSMSLTDAWQDQTRASRVASSLNLPAGTRLSEQSRTDLARAALSNGLREKLAGEGDRKIHVHAFAEKMSSQSQFRTARGQSSQSTAVATSGEISKSDLLGRNTAIGSSLHQIMMAYRGMPVSGALIISDGQSNSGESSRAIAERAKEKGIVVHALAVGTKRGPSNASIVKLDTNPVAFVNDTNSLGVLIEARGMANAETNLVLERRRDSQAWQEVERKSVLLSDDETVQEVAFQFFEEDPGDVELRVRLEELESEWTSNDNVAVTKVRMIPQRIRALLIAGSTFPEVQFIRNTLMLDKGIEVSTWNQAAEDDYENPGNNPILRLPTSDDELNEYDCVILYDPDPTKWPSNFGELLNHFVSYAGGGLIYVAGEMQTESSFRNQANPELSWIKLLPVVRDAGLFRTDVKLKLSARNAWRLLITPDGQRSHVLSFAEGTEANKRVIESLPGMYWHFPVTRAKASAQVLARHGDPRMRNEFGPEVLLASHRVGPGRVFFLGFDSTYRWRYLDEQTFDGFWARMVDQAGRTKQLGGGYPFRLRTDKLAYEPGAQVRLSAVMIQGSDREDIETVHAEVETTAGSQQLLLQPGKREGEFETTFSVAEAGIYAVRAWTGDRGADSEIKTVAQQIEVSLPNAEFEKPTLDRGQLELIASTTGGRVFDLAEIDQIPDAIKLGRVEKVLEDRNELWNAPLMFGAILVMMTMEWILRKRWQMA